MKSSVRKILFKFELFRRYIAHRNLQQYFNQTGWLISLSEIASVDKDCAPIPWITYPALHFIEPKIQPGMKVLEFGSGNSTLWWAKRTSEVVSCEHDSEWHSKIVEMIPANVTYLLRNIDNSDYSRVAKDYANYFDIIIIDGRDRVNCIMNSLKSLRDHGVIIWDNSERTKYQSGFDFLKSEGFSRIDFFGHGPINGYAWCTSIFYKDVNCFNI